MRRTYIPTGIQERLNVLLGTNDPAGTGELTAWSIQASMIENIRRAVRGITKGNINGLIMNGLNMTAGSGWQILISEGTSFTPAGNIITLRSNISKTIPAATVGSSLYIYIMYAEDLTDVDAGAPVIFHESEVMGAAVTPQNIIADEILAGTDQINTWRGKIVISTSPYILTEDEDGDGIYIGKIMVITDTPTFAFVPNTSDWFDYSSSSTLTGWSGTPTAKIYCKKDGKIVYVIYEIVGTSNSDGAYFTVPYNIVNSDIYTTGYGEDSVKPDLPTLVIGEVFNDNLIAIYYGPTTSTGWTASGTKRVKGQFFYQTV